MASEPVNPIDGKTLGIAIGGIIVVIALLCIVFTLINPGGTITVQNADAETTTDEPCDIETERAHVVRVIDGDTFEATLDSTGETVTVRLIGIDTPESVNPDESKNTEKGKAASDHMKKRLVQDTELWLERDTSDIDKYGRLLRYAWTKNPCVGSLSITDSLNGELIRDGWAVPMRIEPDTKYADFIDALYADVKAGLASAADAVDGAEIDLPDVDVGGGDINVNPGDIDINGPDSPNYKKTDDFEYLFL